MIDSGVNLGTVIPGSTIYVPFGSTATSGASSTISGLVVGDIKIYKNGSTTERASTSGFTLLDTDGIDFDGIVGINGFSINLADNTTAGFYACGSRYFVVVSSITNDGQTVNFVAAQFLIGYPDALLNTTIAALISQTSFELTAGPAENDALNGMEVVIHDVASAVQMGRAVILDYDGGSKGVTLLTPTTFTIAATDHVSVIGPSPLQTGSALVTGAELMSMLRSINSPLHPLRIGLLGWYRNGVTDYSGNNHDLVQMGIQETTTGINGETDGAIVLGFNEGQLQNFVMYNYQGPLTWSFWAKCLDGPSADRANLVYQRGSTGADYVFEYSGPDPGGHRRFSWDTGPGVGSLNVTSPSGTIDGNWHHYIATMDAATPSNGAMYIDGVLVDTSVGTMKMVVAQTGEFWWGYFGGEANRWASQNLGIWNRVLSTTDVTLLYNSGVGYDPTTDLWSDVRAWNGTTPNNLVSGNVPISVQVAKNTELAAFPFFMRDIDNPGTGKEGLTITATRSINGAAFAACTNSVNEIGDGWYRITLSAADLNGTTIALNFDGGATAQITAYTLVPQN